MLGGDPGRRQLHDGSDAAGRGLDDQRREGRRAPLLLRRARRLGGSACMPSPDYVREKLSLTMTLLATGAEPLQVRLRGAHNALHALGPADFPEPDDGAALQRILTALTA